MEPLAGSSRRVRTGLFEIDFGSSEVHKEGRKVPLQEQPFRVLVMLLERPGEVVTRGFAGPAVACRHLCELR